MKMKNSKLEMVIGFNHLSLPVDLGFNPTQEPKVLQQVNASQQKLPASIQSIALNDTLRLEKSIVIQPRAIAETDMNVRHIIPYVFVVGKNDRKILAYQRKGSEGRLNGRWAFGIGGHLNTNHMVTIPYSGSETRIIDMKGSLFNCIKAECEEELGIRTIGGTQKFDVRELKSLEIAGEINLDNSEVSCVHYGLIGVLVLPNLRGYKVVDGAVDQDQFDLEIDHKHKTVSLASKYKDRNYEDWSSLVIDNPKFKEDLYKWMTK